MKKVTFVVIFVLLVGNVFFGVKYYQTQKGLEIQKENRQVLNFSKHFIEGVLKAKKEVDFNTRLKLENEVRDLHDEEILAQWNKFIESKTEITTQEEVVNLLEILINKVAAR